MFLFETIFKITKMVKKIGDTIEKKQVHLTNLNNVHVGLL